MLTREQAQVVADATSLYRPQDPAWTPDEILRILGDTRIREHRNMRDTASALAWCACDPSTQSPARILAPGQWWQNAKAEEHIGPRAPEYRYAHESWDDCHDCGRPKTAHPTRDCTYTAPVREPVTQPADVKAALAEAFKPPARDEETA